MAPGGVLLQNDNVLSLIGSFFHEKPAEVHGLVPADISKLTEISMAPPVYKSGVLKTNSCH